jgi:DNA-binding HxlR family transcriptional regulator
MEPSATRSSITKPATTKGAATRRVATNRISGSDRASRVPATQLADEPQSAEPTQCPLTAAMNAIGGKWSLICLYWLNSGMRRFNELRRLMPDISHKVLTQTLRNLEEEGLTSRKVYAEVPPRVEYRMARHGETVLPILQSVRSWGHEHLDWKRNGNESENENEKQHG